VCAVCSEMMHGLAERWDEGVEEGERSQATGVPQGKMESRSGRLWAALSRFSLAPRCISTQNRNMTKAGGSTSRRLPRLRRPSPQNSISLSIYSFTPIIHQSPPQESLPYGRLGPGGKTCMLRERLQSGICGLGNCRYLVSLHDRSMADSQSLGSSNALHQGKT